MPDSRHYERIDIELPCRLFIPGEKGSGLKFQAFTHSTNLSLGGLFVQSSFLLREDLEIFVEMRLPTGPLAIRSRVAHVVSLDDEDSPSGMGIEFLDVDMEGRETLLRYFAPERYREFHRGFIREFPHLERDFPLTDVALLVNLWEEWKIMAEGGPRSTASGITVLPHRHAASAPH